MNEHEILTAAIRTFGDTAQENVAIEECAERIRKEKIKRLYHLVFDNCL